MMFSNLVRVSELGCKTPAKICDKIQVTDSPSTQPLPSPQKKLWAALTPHHHPACSQICGVEADPSLEAFVQAGATLIVSGPQKRRHRDVSDKPTGFASGLGRADMFCENKDVDTPSSQFCQCACACIGTTLISENSP